MEGWLVTNKKFKKLLLIADSRKIRAKADSDQPKTNTMRKIVLFFSLMIIMMIGPSCKKSMLQQINPNQPNLTSLTTEEGITSFALGIFEKWLAPVPNEGNVNIMVVAWARQSILGDETFCPYGNYGFRWTDQVYSITLPNGTVIINPNGKEQKPQLQGFNSRQAGENNAFVYEWEVNSFLIAQSNLLLQSLDNPALTFSGDANTKRNTLKAWAYWWKGYGYSRIGSAYIAGVINNSPADGNTSDHFVDRTEVIAEANKNFESCASILLTLPNSADYNAMMQAIVPSIFYTGLPVLDLKNGIVAPDMWLRQVYTYEARNSLVNKKVKDMTAADWAQLQTLTAKGIRKEDNIFVYALDANLINDLNGQFAGQGSPYAMFGTGSQYLFTSERLIQDFKPGDQRFVKGFAQLPPSDWNVNIRGRGLQFGNRYDPVSIEDGGLYASNDNSGIINIAGTWDENALMTAEAKIRSGGDVEGGLQLIDAVRLAQGAELAPVAGKGLSQVQAIEELRRERRIGLLLRGLAFYDARRWGITDPVSAGGGRNGAIVLIPPDALGLPGTSPPQPLPCIMDYRYMDYWDVPQNELDFNNPGAGSVPVKK